MAAAAPTVITEGEIKCVGGEMYWVHGDKIYAYDILTETVGEEEIPLLLGDEDTAPTAPSAQDLYASSRRIRDRDGWIAYIGGICTYKTTEGIEFGRIRRVTTHGLGIDRLRHTETGEFVPHPERVCTWSNNCPHFTSRDIRLVEVPPAMTMVMLGRPLMPVLPDDAEEPPRRQMFCVPEDAEEPPLAAVTEAVRVPDAEIAAASLRLLKARRARETARIAELEQRVALLTEAVTMLLGMKADAEHFAITRTEAVLERVPAMLASGGGGHFPPPRVHFWAGPSYTPTTTATSSCLEDYTTALEELQANATKTDSLLAALRPGGT